MECEKIKYFHDGDQLIAFNVRTLKVFRFKSELKAIPHKPLKIRKKNGII